MVYGLLSTFTYIILLASHNNHVEDIKAYIHEMLLA